MKQVEQVLKHVPAKQLSLKPIGRTFEEDPALFARRNAGARASFCDGLLEIAPGLARRGSTLTTCMERVHLVTTEQARELSRLNNKLYECVLQVMKPRRNRIRVVSHVIIKAVMCAWFNKDDA